MDYRRNGLILGKKYKEYLIPTILSSMAVLLASFVDGIIVSFLVGAEAFSAISFAEPVVLLMQVVFFLFGIGATIGISVAKGERDEKKANALFALAIIYGIVVSVVIVIVGLIFCQQIARLLMTNESVLGYLSEYILGTIIGAPLMIFVPMMSFIVRADGRPGLSARILLISNISNLALDFVFIGLFKMSTFGAALATVAGYGVGLIIVIYYFVNKKRSLRFVPNREMFKYSHLLLKGGRASTINTALLLLKAALLNQIVMSFNNPDAIFVFSVCNFMLTFVSMFVSGASDAMSPIAGMLYGEKDYKGLSFLLKRTLMVVLACSIVCVAIIFIAPEMIMDLFNSTGAGQHEMGRIALRIFGISLIGMGVNYTLMNYLQATYKRNIASYISIARGLIFIIPFAYIFSITIGINGVWSAFVIAEVITLLTTLLIMYVLYKKGKNRYISILLLEKLSDQELVCDISVDASDETAVGVSKQLIGLCRNSQISEKTSNFVGLVAEEMIENIKNANIDGKDKLVIDITCRIFDDYILLNARDNGTDLSAVVTDNEEFSSLKMLKAVSKEVEYARVLGLNNTVVKLEKQ